jgi:glycerol-3-phosphate responsive antiterminator
MPITIKDYTWHQTEKTLQINASFPILLSSKVLDIFHSNKYLKVSHPPYILEVFLEHGVQVSNTRCIIQETNLDFEIFKEADSLWTDVKKFNFDLRYEQKNVVTGT